MSAMDPGHSSEQILKRAAEVCRAVRSYRVVETQYHEAGAHRSVEKEERILAGSDEYRRRLDADDTEEWLDFHGESYFRSTDGEWEKMTLVDSAVLHVTSYTTDPSLTAAADLDAGLFRIWDVARIERLSDEELGGRRFIAFEEAIDFSTPLSGSKDEGYSTAMTQRLWFCADDLLLHRHEYVMENYYMGQLTGRTRQISEFSDFNTAELPGPLPQS